MAFELYPQKNVGVPVGKKSGWGSGTKGSKARYPGKSLPTTEDSTKTHKVAFQHGNGASAPGDDYPKRSVNFPGLDGLPPS